MNIENSLYDPIYKKIESWIAYEKAKPKSSYNSNRKEHDEFRKNNDLDCILRGGNLNADTIFSLWIPLRFSIVNLNTYKDIERITGRKVDKNIYFLESLISNGNLEKLLPKEKNTTVLLSKLFSLGQKIENTMIFPDRKLQERGSAPYYDYMPYFLFECFKGGYFCDYFRLNEELIDWIKREHLECFFDGAICQENIIDLANTGNLKNGVPTNIDVILTNYVQILKDRKRYFKIYINHASQ